MLAIVFVGAEAEHHCKLPEEYRSQPLNQTIPYEEKDGERFLSKCQVYVNYTIESNETIDCPNGWNYSNDIYTIRNEWDLVCDRSVMVETSQTILVLGVLVGAMVMAILSDMYGRKKVCFASILANGALGFITAWVNNYYLFAVCRFFTGMLQQGIVLPGFILACEMFPAEQRTVAGLVVQVFWGIGMCVLALIAYLVRNWRHLLIATCVPSVVVIPLLWIVPESIPWLVAKRRVKEAKQILQKAAKFNGVELPAEFRLSEEEAALLQNGKKNDVKSNEEKPSVSVRIRNKAGSMFKRKPKEKSADYTLLDVFKSAKLRIFALIMCYLWCVSSLVYYGLSLSTGSLAGDRYVNFFLSGIVEVPAYLAAAAALQFIGRRYPICAFHFIAGIPLLITLAIPETLPSGKNLVPLIVTFSMISKFGIAACFGCVFLYAPELFPTTIRNASMGIASVGGRLGNLVAPFSSYVVKVLPWFPGLLFGVMAIIGGLMTLFLPETLHRPLPLTITEVENWSRTLSKEEKEQHRQSVKEAKDRRKENVEMKPVANDIPEKEPLNDIDTS